MTSVSPSLPASRAPRSQGNSNNHNKAIRRSESSTTRSSSENNNTAMEPDGGISSNSNINDPVLQAITSKQNCLLQPAITLTMYIPTASVGAVIGRRGQNIANLQKIASTHTTTSQPVRISVIGQDSTESMPYTYSELDLSDSANWTPVVIRADPKACFVAGQKVEETVANCVDHVVLDVPISRTKHAAVVGKRGLALATMSADTHVRIMVPNKDLHHDVIQLEGDLAAVKQCLDRVLAVAIKAKKMEDMPSGTVIVQQLPPQTKLRTVGRRTDTSIKKKKLEDTTWQLIVTGSSAEGVQTAIGMLQKWNEDATNKPTNPDDAEASSPQDPSGNGQLPRNERWGKRTNNNTRGRGPGRGNNRNRQGSKKATPSGPEEVASTVVG